MASTITVLLVLLVALSGVVSVSPFNITEILKPYPDLRIFNDLLSRTKVAALINSRQTITVLALDNRALSPFTREPLENIKPILMVHVLLDFISSVPKIKDLRGQINVTNLFQTTGLAEGDQGLVVVDRTSAGDIRFWAAGQREKPSKLLEEVYKQPYNISVLRVSDVIIPPGMVTRYQPYAPPPLGPSPSPGPTQEPRAPTPAYVPAPGSHLAPSPVPASDDSSPPPEPDADDSSPSPGDDDDAPGEAPSASGGPSSNVGVAVAMSCLMVWRIGFPY